MPKFKGTQDFLDWIIRLQGAYAILATILAGSFGTGVRAVLHYHTHIPSFWVTPIWLLSVALVLVLLLISAKQRWISEDHPDFDFQVSSIIWLYNAGKDYTVFYVGARIMNKGAPSITQDWSANYIVGTTSEPMKPYYLVGPTVLTLGEEQLTIENNDLLSVKTSEKAIERGGAVHGRLVFTVPGNRDAQIKSLQHRIEVCVHDFLSNPYTSVYIPSAVPASNLIRHPHENARFIKSSEVPSIALSPSE